MKIRKCVHADFETMYWIINEAASAYKNVIPSDRWKDPYMPRTELKHEIDEGVLFYGYEENGKLLGPRTNSYSVIGLTYEPAKQSLTNHRRLA